MIKKYARRNSKRSHKMQRGQILVIVVFAIVGLVSFVGLVVDTGLVFISYGRLRRATDAAALAAAAQYRADPNPAHLALDAINFLQLNDIYDPDTGEPWKIVKVCNDSYPAYHDPSLCTVPAKRRLVKVTAQNTVQLAFLPVIGIRTVTLHATATSEAASLDIVLAIDVSESMTFDAPTDSALRDPSICNVRVAPDPYSQCYPFHDIQKAAHDFIESWLADPSNVYDRVAVIPFDRNAHKPSDTNNPALDLTSNWTQVLNRITNMNVYDATGVGATPGPVGGGPNGACLGTDYPPAGVPCRGYPSDSDLHANAGHSELGACYLADGITPDFSKDGPTDGCWMPTDGTPYTGAGSSTYYLDPVSNQHFERAYLDFACGSPAPDDRAICGTTNIGDAFRTAGDQFDPNKPGWRQESLWVVILLTDGLANHSSAVDSVTGQVLNNVYCPTGENLNGHWCQDSAAYSMFSRHCLAASNTLYNGNAFLYNSCMAAAGATSPFGSGGSNPGLYDADDYARDMADFVALGQQALVYTIGFGDGKGTFGEPGMGHSDQSTPGVHSGLDWGEQLMKYAADLGDDGQVNDTWANNYFYAPNAGSLQDIFTKISERIATRLSH